MKPDVGQKATWNQTVNELAPPPPGGLLRESTGVIQLARLVWRFPILARQARGRGRPVLVLPGFGAGDPSTAVLRGYLAYLGYAARGWGLGRNRGDVPALLPRVTALVAATARQSGQPVSLVGWSLGGYLAREAAREGPARVARVITMGSPVIGGPKYTTAAVAYRNRGHDVEALAAAVAERNKRPLPVPITAIYSRRDGVVAWRACLDTANPHVEHVEVRSTHFGLGFDPDVYLLIARRLAGNTPTGRPHLPSRSGPAAAK